MTGQTQLLYLSCKFCKSLFSSKTDWKEHALSHHKPEIFDICVVCCKSFKTPIGLQQHNQNYHSTSTKFRCNLCDKAFISGRRLNVHLRGHSSEKPFICKICGTSYKHKKNLDEHINIKHSGGHWLVRGILYRKEKNLAEYLKHCDGHWLKCAMFIQKIYYWNYLYVSFWRTFWV